PFPPLWRDAPADALRPQAAGGAALHPRRLEDRGRPLADRRGGCRNRRRFGRCRLGTCLSHRRIRLPAQHPAHVRGAASPPAGGHRHLLRAVARLASHAAALARERHRARDLGRPCALRAAFLLAAVALLVAIALLALRAKREEAIAGVIIIEFIETR